MERNDLENKTISLTGAQQYLTDHAGDMFQVLSGTVNIYIAPLKDGKPEKKLFLYAAGQGQRFPAFCCRDSEYKNWRFLLLAEGSAELSVVSDGCTSILYKNFARRVSQKGFEEEGFEGSLISFYDRNSLQENLFFEREKKGAPKTEMASYGILADAFRSGNFEAAESEPMMKLMARACKALKQPLPDGKNRRSTAGTDIPELAEAYGLICRDVVLENGWSKQDCGVIVSRYENRTVLCVPEGIGKYTLYDPETSEQIPLTQQTAEQINPKAYTLEKTLPARKLTKKDIREFAKKSLYTRDLWMVIVLGIVGALIGILLPTLNQKIYDDYIPLGNYSQLIQICAVIASFMLGNALFSVVKSLSEMRLSSHIGYAFQDAVYHRLFYLPSNFFRQYDSADLAQRAMTAGGLLNQYADAVFVTGFAQIFSLIYLIRMFTYSAKLSGFALIMVAVYALVAVFIQLRAVKYEKTITEANGEESARLFQYFSGIEKIRMAGAEERAVYEYLRPFAKEQAAGLCKSKPEAFSGVFGEAAGTVFSMVFYYIIVKKKLDLTMGQFIAFNTAMGSFTRAALQTIDKAMALYGMKPAWKRLGPILETVPENGDNNERVETLTGAISLRNVCFSYGKGMPQVLNGITADIKPGEYVGIVGSSGGGKSTLLKLLLGFEKPTSGEILYDGKNITTLNKNDLRKNLGVVLQNGKLIAGSIQDNITITAPRATLKEVNQVIEAVGLKNDIDAMPMGVQTIVNETAGTISGGQQQRILIARAIIRHPSILIFDEATSALDNITQAMVSESLDKMNITRIVVAHRLSTIKNCDRILVLKDGIVAEQGTYEQLMALKGLFYELASRQIA